MSTVNTETQNSKTWANQFLKPAHFTRNIKDGNAKPLGATVTKSGVNFAVTSKAAQEVFLVLFDIPNAAPIETIKMKNHFGDVWHIHVEGLKAGQLYGFRINGTYDPLQGLRFNVNKLLADPYAKAFTGKFNNSENLLLAYDVSSDQKDLSFDTRDNASVVPKCIVMDDSFDWEGDKSPNIPPEQLIIYEVHVKGFTAHPSSQVKQPGTYLGFIEKIPYLKELGITAVELLPVHEFVCEDSLKEKGLTNYWGYNTIGFFAPESSYSSQGTPGCAVNEFKTLVKALHKAGIEVILDVVYNHTAEGNECGPTLCFKGLDNQGYYSLCGEEGSPQRFYKNYSGTGNTLNAGSPIVKALVLDSLRYWAKEMHVDGFRFDLAACLGRDHTGAFSPSGHLLAEITKDPLLTKLKLIAEPWDMETYEVGGLSEGWSEWNGKFRDCIRKFAKGDAGQIPELSSRISGSPDLFAHSGRKAIDSINFITCHDGFTLYDLVSYNEKHNQANLENNADGANDNNSWNCGAEGETDSAEILALRKRQIKNLFCYQMLSLGTPMISSGDEFLKTQKGNNNVYAQDNEISWIDWSLKLKNAEIVEFVKSLVQFRRTHKIFQTGQFFTGEDKSENGIPDVVWVGPDDGNLHWEDLEQRCLAYQIDGSESLPSNSTKDNYRLFIIFNAGSEPHSFNLPGLPDGDQWYRVIDTSLPKGEDFQDSKTPISESFYRVNDRSSIVLKSKRTYIETTS